MGDVWISWVTFQTEENEISIVSVRGPVDREGRTDLRNWMQSEWRSGTWPVTGVWYTADRYEDFIGDGPIQRGVEKATWIHFNMQLDLDGVCDLLTYRSGPCFMRQRIARDRLQQARLDRVYFSEDRILVELHGFYSKLFQAEPETEAVQLQRQEVLRGMCK
ncbi:hypothetical protein R1sor_023551 [Riccia sorocarpa]|uniref:Uncharacterized protein n=1 Tax=Riccia sorocarpa TaxID=122646 RepID=A0ABD3GMZ6_9MARC